MAGAVLRVQVPVKYGLVHRFPAATPRHKRVPLITDDVYGIRGDPPRA